MSWIESHQSLGKHPKLLRLAAQLRIHKAQAVGHLQYLWWWALDFAPNGNLSAFASAEISAACEWPGSQEQFMQSLKDCGWIDSDGYIHDWEDYAGRLLERKEKKRIQDRERQRKHRESIDDVTRDSPATRMRVTQCHAPTLPNQTLPNLTKTLCPTPNGARLAEGLRDWIKRNNPGAKVPEDLSKWAVEADLMLEHDKRDLNQAVAVLDWCQQDGFWKTNILSIQKFRKQYDQLYLKSQEKPVSVGNKPITGGAQPIPGEYANIKDG